jgi:hypothetical protein
MMDSAAHVLVSALACALGAMVICVLVIRYGFTRDSELPIGSRGPKPSQLGHAIAAALFGAGVVFAVLALTALPLGGMESYRDFTDRLLQRVDRLRARLGVIEGVVEQLGERADRSVRAAPRIRASDESSPAAPTVAGLVASPPVVSGLTQSSTPPSRSFQGSDLEPNTSAGSISAPPQKESGAPEARRRGTPPRGVAAPESVGHERMDKTTTRPSEKAPHTVAGRSRREADADVLDEQKLRPSERGRQLKQVDSMTARFDAAENRSGTADSRDRFDVSQGERAVPVDQKMESVQRLERSEKAERADKADKVDKPDKVDMLDKVDKVDGLDKVDKVDKLDKVEKLDKIVRIERLEKPPKIERPEKLEKIERLERRGK